MRDTNVEPGTLQLILDQLEELVVTLIEEIRERPGVALAAFAGLGGALIGAALAARTRNRRASAPAAVARGARNLGAASEMLGLSLRLLQNPIVRGLVLAAVQKQLRRRMPL
jgi:dihydroxyacetone kinase DhaKLM complex PTS-EIIA-like component DhaM